MSCDGDERTVRRACCRAASMTKTNRAGGERVEGRGTRDGVCPKGDCGEKESKKSKKKSKKKQKKEKEKEKREKKSKEKEKKEKEKEKKEQQQ